MVQFNFELRENANIFKSFYSELTQKLPIVKIAENEYLMAVTLRITILI